MSHTTHVLQREWRIPDLAAGVRTLSTRIRALLIHTAAMQAVWSAALQRNLDRGRRI